ncbi:hypothetical protein E4U45_004096 [Claviceps purpurea]|nr:hypothetical protein E4U45_004096 [Claviceps purpurea]
MIYNDAKAAELDSIKQKPKERFEDYCVRYEDLLAKSESLDLPDREKIIMIQRGLRRDFDLQMCSGRDPKEGLRGCCGETAGSRGRTGGLRASGDETAYTVSMRQWPSTSCERPEIKKFKHRHPPLTCCPPL